MNFLASLIIIVGAIFAIMVSGVLSSKPKPGRKNSDSVQGCIMIWMPFIIIGWLIMWAVS